MNYVTREYYNDKFKGESVDETDFPGLLERASEIVEEMTMYRLNPVNFANMQEDLQDKVRMAVCAQIEYLEANGGSEVDNSQGLQSASLGKFSYTSAGSNAGTASGQTVYAPRAQRILMPTGLLYRGGGRY